MIELTYDQLVALYQAIEIAMEETVGDEVLHHLLEARDKIGNQIDIADDRHYQEGARR